MLGSSKEPNIKDYKKVKVYYRCKEIESGPKLSTTHDIENNNLGINDGFISQRVKQNIKCFPK